MQGWTVLRLCKRLFHNRYYKPCKICIGNFAALHLTMLHERRRSALIWKEYDYVWSIEKPCCHLEALQPYSFWTAIPVEPWACRFGHCTHRHQPHCERRGALNEASWLSSAHSAAASQTDDYQPICPSDECRFGWYGNQALPAWGKFVRANPLATTEVGPGWYFVRAFYCKNFILRQSAASGRLPVSLVCDSERPQRVF